MRTSTKAATAILAVGLATSMAACSSSGGSKKPQGEFKTLTGNTTSVALAPSFLAALTSLKVTPAPTGTATVSKAGVASFPITGGNVKLYKKGDVTPYVQGQLDHNGSGLSLTAGSTVVDLKNFVVDPGNNSKLTGEVDVDGKVAFKSVKLFDLDGNTLKTPTLSGGVATLTGTTVWLSTEAAGALNKVFKISALKGGVGTGVKIGVATIKATGK